MHFLATLLGCFFGWSITRKGKQPAQAVLACTFGRACNSNERIAFSVHAIHREQGIPLCVQGEVGDCLPTKAGGYVAAHTYDVHRKGYNGTRQTVEEMVDKFCRPNNITRVHVVAHPHHAWRVVKVCEKLGLQVVNIETREIGYDPKSRQTWCRSAWNPCRTFPYPPFIPYEILARLLYLKKGWV